MKCEICKTRPVMSAKSKRERGTDFPYCDPCQDEAEWENQHSDYDHDGIAARNATRKDAGIVGQDEMGYALADCWVCHPELNKASADYVERRGTSRAGMVMNVTRSQTPKEKADVVLSKIKKSHRSYAVTVSTRGGLTKLRAAKGNGEGVVLVWDSKGRYVYEASERHTGGKVTRVRNVAAALRSL
jgi:hypothetical protein